MKKINLKPYQKLIDLSRAKVLIHPQAEDALSLWQRFKSRNDQIDLRSLDKLYRPPLRLIAGNASTMYFVNDFARVDNILISNPNINNIT